MTPVGRLVTWTLIAAGVLVLASCAAGPNPASTSDADAGFWLGLWHGFITPFTFLISLFRDDINLYEVDNNGNWYDFGFVIGLAAIWGSGSGANSARKK